MRCSDVFMITMFVLMPLQITFAADADRVESALAECAACHGAAGKPSDPTIPIIWGQKAEYLDKQLRDYRSGERDNQIMSSMAESVPVADITRAAALLASRQWPGTSATAPGVAPPAGLTDSCKGCHGANFTGGPSPEGFAPRLAGQFAEYLEYQMGAFAREERANQKSMSAIMKSLTAADRSALASYLASH